MHMHAHPLVVTAFLCVCFECFLFFFLFPPFSFVFPSPQTTCFCLSTQCYLHLERTFTLPINLSFLTSSFFFCSQICISGPFAGLERRTATGLKTQQGVWGLIGGGWGSVKAAAGMDGGGCKWRKSVRRGMRRSCCRGHRRIDDLLSGLYNLGSWEI